MQECVGQNCSFAAALAPLSLAGTNASARGEALAAVKDALAHHRRQAETVLKETGSGLACARMLSDVQDRLIKNLFTLASQTLYPAVNPSAAERLSVVAVGGYGRGALAPGSDIDLLFVLPYKQTAWGESVAEFLLYFLWDLGFKVGQASRSVDECIRLSKTDNTILTSILEARLICGDEDLFAELHSRFRADVVAGRARQFIADKLAERDERHERAGASRYLVEPDVKDGKGALRDLHTLIWIARFVCDIDEVDDLVGKGVFSRAELHSFLKCEDFLWAVRCHLHFMTGRADNRLSFERQADLAGRLGYGNHGGLSQVERFMRHYFLVAKEVGDLTRIFCAVLEAGQMKPAPRMSQLFSRLAGKRVRLPASAKGFCIDAGRLNVTGGEAFTADPINIMRLFALADRYDVAIHPTALRHVRRSLRLIDKAFRADRETNRLFMAMLCDSKDPETILRRLNEAGVLGRFIPDFGRIVAMMQFNMYHHYTVDEHLLRTVGILSRIESGSLVDDHPLSCDIVHTLKSRRVLYVAALLHDIAKGRNEDHSIAGEQVAKKLCPRLGLTAAETDAVAWLVRHHLLMSETSQMRDLGDFKTILDFAAQVQSPERLKLLLILTVVDIRAVGPGVWNGWKGQLLRTLYFETEPLLTGGHSRITRQTRVSQAKQAFAEAIKTQADWDESAIGPYMERHGSPYWLTTDVDHQVAHATLIKEAEQDRKPLAYDVRTDAFTSITEVTVFAPDHPRLLAMLTGACAAAGANIAGAKIFTTSDGMALDTLLIQRELAEEKDELRRARRIGEIFSDIVSGRRRLADLLAGRRDSRARLKAFHVEPQVIIDNRSSNRHTVIEIAGLDRIGLLHELTEAIYRLNVNIASAHIATFGERAVDVFYVTDLTGGKIINESRNKRITRQLLAVLQDGAGQSAGGKRDEARNKAMAN